jgi:hypothetical protein
VSRTGRAIGNTVLALARPAVVLARPAQLLPTAVVTGISVRLAAVAGNSSQECASLAVPERSRHTI